MNPRPFIFLLLATLCLAGARAEDSNASATLSEESTVVGQPVELQIKVTGTRDASRPVISVDGLDITFEGASTQVQMNNFVVTTSVLYTYSVKATRAGTFTIPGQVIDAGGAKIASNAVSLTVTGSAAATGSSAANRLAFAELVLPKSSAYVGEMLPVELRVYVDTRVRWQFGEPPTIDAPGFSVQKLTQPAQSEVHKNGRTYDMVVFKTAICAVKSGKLPFGPATITCQAQIPQKRPSIPHFGNDPFADSFFNNPFAAFSAPEEITIKTDPTEVEAKPLPRGAPASFSGGVGSFTLSVDASPLKVAIGDPITLVAAVSGWGNLEGVGAPRVADDEGVKLYPPSSKIKTDDDVGIRGTKTFQVQVVPLRRKQVLPAVEFSYFNPLSEKYVSLTGKRIPIQIEGGSPLAEATPPSAHVQAATPAPEPQKGILYIRTDFALGDASFQPLYEKPGFWAAQLVPLCALAGFAAVRRRTAKTRSERARHLAEFRREKNALLRVMKTQDVSYPRFLEAATRLVQLETANITQKPAALIDADAACDSRRIASSTAGVVKEIFASHEELNYSGGAGQATMMPPEKRSRFLAALQEFEHAAPSN